MMVLRAADQQVCDGGLIRRKIFSIRPIPGNYRGTNIGVLIVAAGSMERKVGAVTLNVGEIFGEYEKRGLIAESAEGAEKLGEKIYVGASRRTLCSQRFNLFFRCAGRLQG